MPALFSGFFSDLRYAARALRKRPGMTATALLTLALGIGVGAAIFSIVNAILIQPLPYKDPDRLLMVWNLNEQEGYSYEDTKSQGDSMSPAEFLDWRDARIFEQMTLFGPYLTTITGTDSPEMTHGYRLSEGGFEMLGVQPLDGRLPTPAEFTQGGEAVILLRHVFWRRRFNADPAALGQTLELNGRPHRIIGVMPPGFIFFNRQSEFLVPFVLADRNRQDRERRGYRVMAQLADGMNLEEAQTRATQFSLEMERRHPEFNRGWRVKLLTVADDAAGELRPPLLVLLAAVGCVLLIMCANIANLLLVHASARSRELAVRTALGCGRWRVARQLLIESMVLSLVGGALGVGLCFVIVGYFQRMTPDRFAHSKYLLQIEAVRVDPWVVGFALLVAAAAGLLFGLIPALRASKPDLTANLKDAGRGSAGGLRDRGLRSTLVVAEVAVGLVLLVAASLLIRSFAALYERGPGIEKENRITFIAAMPSLEIAQQLREEDPSREEFFSRYQARLRTLNEAVFAEIAAVPGVRNVAAISTLPMQGWFQPRELTIEGRADENERNAPSALFLGVTPNYFGTMGIPLLRGRGFNALDGSEAAPVCIISNEAADRYWPGEDPIGRNVKPGDPSSTAPWLRIVGVVGGVRESGMQGAPAPAVYTSSGQGGLARPWLVVETEGPPDALLPSIRGAVRRTSALTAIYRVREMKDIVRDSAWQLNYSMTLLSGLAALALLLAAVGVYGVLSYAVRERTREFGVRMALGAQRSEVFSLVVRKGLTLVGAGLAIGLVIAAVLTRFLSSLLFGVQPIDALTFGLAAAALLAAGFLACWLPARRATAVAPMEALRHE